MKEYQKYLTERFGISEEDMVQRIQDYVKSQGLQSDAHMALVQAMDKALGTNDLRKILNKIRTLLAAKS